VLRNMRAVIAGTVAARIEVSFDCPPHTPPTGVASASSFKPHTAHTILAALTALFSSFCVLYVAGIHSGVGVLLRILLMRFKLGQQMGRRAFARTCWRTEITASG
jgi:hypothetical protein